MKSFFTISFLISMLFTASTAFSYDCYGRNPPEIRPCAYPPRYQEPQYGQQQPRPSRCDCGRRYAGCNSCRKNAAYQGDRQGYQCEITYTQKKEQIKTVRCRLCGTRYPEGVEHYCNRVQCRTCGQMHARDIEHRCGAVQCRTCGVHYQQGMRHRCGETRSRRQDCSQGDCYQGNTCRYESRHRGSVRQCATRNCNPPRKETRETRWRTWFKDQVQEETVF